jgi:Flp pilus assembly pilin Flp
LQGEEDERMKQWIRWISNHEFWKDTQGQDLIEYALMAGFVAVAAGAIMPNVTQGISTIFSKLQSVFAPAREPASVRSPAFLTKLPSHNTSAPVRLPA